MSVPKTDALPLGYTPYGGPLPGGRKGDAKEAYISDLGPGVPQPKGIVDPRSGLPYGYFLSNIIRWISRKLSLYYI